MKSYWLDLGAGRDDGPFSTEQVTRLFADRRIDRNTLCKTDRLAEWRTVDEFFPTLKYGSEVPHRAAALFRFRPQRRRL